MPERLCSCGNKLSSINHSLKCYTCKEKERYEKRRQEGQKKLDEAKAAGRVRLHSCISHALDPTPQRCGCRKFVTYAAAREYIRIGRAVDLHTREACFHEREIIEKSRHKTPPISSLGQRIAIERKSEEFGASIVRMKAVIEEDNALRAQEKRLKIAIEHEIALEEQAKLIVFVDEKTFDEMKAQNWGRPDLFVTTEERTSLGQDVGPKLDSPIDDAQDTEESEILAGDEDVDAIDFDGPEPKEDDAGEVEIDTDYEEFEEEIFEETAFEPAQGDINNVDGWEAEELDEAAVRAQC